MFPKGDFNVFTTGKTGTIELVEISMWKNGKPAAPVVAGGKYSSTKDLKIATRLQAPTRANWKLVVENYLVNPGGTPREIDFVIVGDNVVFLVDEKSWTGRIEGDETWWTVDRSFTTRNGTTTTSIGASVLWRRGGQHLRSPTSPGARRTRGTRARATARRPRRRGSALARSATGGGRSSHAACRSAA